MRRRRLTPAAGILAAAFVLSLVVHLQGYVGLGYIKTLMDRALLRAQPERSIVEIDFEGAPSADARPDPSAEADPVSDDVLEPAPPPARTPSDEVAARVRRDPRAQHDEQPPEPPAAVRATPRPPPEAMNKQAVQQRSHDPSVEPPPDSRFIADENNRVAEETAARLRNYQRDDPEQSPGQEHESEVSELGNDDAQEVADAREMEGSDARTPTEREANARRPRRADDEPPPDMPAHGDTARTGAASSSSGASRADATGSRAGGAAPGGGREAPRLIEVNDGQGTFVIAVGPSRRPGAGPGEAGGRSRPGEGAGRSGQGAGARSQGLGRLGERGLGRGTGSSGPDLRVSWSQFEEVYSSQRLARERERWLRERRSRLRGSNRQRDWRRFRAAIENYLPNVRPGNQTALNAAASPFAGYIAAIHRRIHRQFAYRFLASLPAGGTSPFADRTLMTKLEIILNRDGSVHRVGVVATSGFLAFDYGAFRSVLRAQPYPEPPRSILSGDGRVYLHWGFYRNERQCGTFNAEPYILPNPPGTPRVGGGPLRDRLQQGGLVPGSAAPTWGTERAPSTSPSGGDDAPAGGPDQSEPGGPGEGAPGDREGVPPAPSPEEPEPLRPMTGSAVG